MYSLGAKRRPIYRVFLLMKRAATYLGVNNRHNRQTISFLPFLLTFYLTYSSADENYITFSVFLDNETYRRLQCKKVGIRDGRMDTKTSMLAMPPIYTELAILKPRCRFFFLLLAFFFLFT